MNSCRTGTSREYQTVDTSRLTLMQLYHLLNMQAITELNPTKILWPILAIPILANVALLLIIVIRARIDKK